MGMFSEIIHEGYVKEYEEILIAGIEEYENNGEGEYSNEYVAVITFLKKHVYPKYDSALGDAYITVVTDNQKRIDEFFKN